MKISLFEIWQRQYGNNRYMEKLTRDELKQRAKDVFLNNLVLTGDCKIDLAAVNEEGQYWREKIGVKSSFLSAPIKTGKK